MSRLTTLTIESIETVGFMAKYSDPTSPFSSAVTATNMMDRRVGSPSANKRAVSSITEIPKPEIVASSSVVSIKKEYDEETVGSINHEEENSDNVTAAAVKKEDEETDNNEAVERCKWVRIKLEDTDDEPEGE